jgi:hypothetical protein
MHPAARTEFVQFHPVGIVPAVLLSRVCPFPAFRARQVDDDPIALSLGHGLVPSGIA